MRKHLIAVAAALAAVLAHSTAEATPYAGAYHTGTAVAVLSGVDHATYRVGFTLTGASPASTSSFATLSVSISRCTAFTCGTALNYSSALPASAYTFANDASAASVDTKVFGRPLSIHWTATGPTPSSSDSTNIPGGFSWDIYKFATARITLLGTSCNDPSAQSGMTIQADATGGASAATGPAIPTTPPPGLRAHGRVRPKCTTR